LGRILCRHGVYLVHVGLDAQILAPLADDKACLLHVHVALAESDGTGYLEVGEAVDLGLVEQGGKLGFLDVLQQFEGLHKGVHICQMRILAQAVVDLDDMLQLLQEPAVDLGEVMNLIYGITHQHGLGNDKDTGIGRMTK